MSRGPQRLKSANLDLQADARRGDDGDLLTQVQVCQRLGISDQTWMRWRKAGRVPDPVVLPSGRRKWRAADITALIDPRPVSSRRRFFGGVQMRAGQLVAVR